MAAAPLLAGLTVAQTGLSMFSQHQAGKAAEAESKHRQQLLKNKASAERKSMITNTGRRLEERKRAMASVRAQQSASGFTAGTGTQLAVFGEIGSRYDEQIDEATNQSLNQVARFRESAQVEKFAQGQRSKANRIGMLSTAVGGAFTGFNRWNKAKDTFGENKPFSIF